LTLKPVDVEGYEARDVLIAGGVSDGDAVVTLGVQKLDPGQKVRVVAAGQFRAADPLGAARCVQSAKLRFCHPALIVQCADEPGPSIDDMCDFILASLRVGSCCDGHRPWCRRPRMEHPGGGAAIFRQAFTCGEVKERASLHGCAPLSNLGTSSPLRVSAPLM